MAAPTATPSQDREFYNFYFMSRRHFETEEYRKNWLYRSAHNHFRFTYNDVLAIERGEEMESSEPLRHWLREYVDSHPDYHINLSLKDDRDECFNAIAYIFWNILYAFFKDCGPLEYGCWNGLKHRDFDMMSYEEFIDWHPYLKRWREAIDAFAPHDDRLLAEKDAEIARLEKMLEEKSCSQVKTKPTLCTYIIPNNIKPEEEVEKEMAEAASKDAPTFVAYLNKAQKLKLVDFRGDKGKTIFDNLKAHFSLGYEYRNFIKYFHQ